jgi:LPXTG-motif cell wall-anchored protein
MPDLKAIPMNFGFLIQVSEAVSPETDTSVWWYVLPTSGFALLLSLYFIIKRKRKD